MFTIKARIPDGTTDIYEAGQLTISADRKTISFLGCHGEQVELYVKDDYYPSVFIENQAGKTIEALYSTRVR